MSSLDNATLSYFSRFGVIIDLHNVNRVKSGLRHILIIPIICIGLCTSVSIITIDEKSSITPILGDFLDVVISAILITFYTNSTLIFSACKRCDLVPILDTVNDHGLCCRCLAKLKCRMCRRYLGPHLYTDGDGKV